MHLTKHAVDVKMSENAASKTPVTIAPITLVATKVMPKRMTEVKSVTKIPKSSKGRAAHTHSLLQVLPPIRAFKKSKTRKPKAIPNVTQRNGTVNVITAVKRSMPATIPIMMDAANAKIEQSTRRLQLQLQLIIFSPLFIL